MASFLASTPERIDLILQVPVKSRLEASWRADLLVRLDLVADLKCLEILKPDTALSALPHLGDVLLVVFERVDLACSRRRQYVRAARRVMGLTK
jgi:hypothetical protein